MKLGIPTLCRYDLLGLLIASAEAGSVKPSEYVVVDNGARLQQSGLTLPPNSRILHSGENLGVAASWNLLLDDAGDEPIVISNDDVVFGPRIFEEMARDVACHPIVVSGWALFAQSHACTAAVGYYDENFWPAYYEDSDYAVRLARAGLRTSWNVTEAVQHAGCWTTANALGHPDWLTRGVHDCFDYFVSKWGGPPSDTHEWLYEQPFNGAPPAGWKLRRQP